MKKLTKNDIEIFITIFLITLVIFIPFLIMHYATDTYNIINIGYKDYAINFSLIDGRLLAFIFSLSFNRVSIVNGDIL